MPSPRPFAKTISIPGSKSLSQRYLLAAALCPQTSELSNLLACDDLKITMDILSKLGVKITPLGATKFSVLGLQSQKIASSPSSPLDCFMGASGTSLRFFLAIFSFLQGHFKIYGKDRLHERPIYGLVKSLQSLGAKINYLEKEGFLPLILSANSCNSNVATINTEESSQYLSALLLAASLSASSEFIIYPQGSQIVSLPYVLLTLQTLEHFKIPVKVEAKQRIELVQGEPCISWKAISWTELAKFLPENLRFIIGTASNPTQKLSKKLAPKLSIEADYSSASYFLAAAALGINGEQGLIFDNLAPASLQADALILDILKKMGAKLSWQGTKLKVQPHKLQGLTIDLGQAPDIVPTVLALAAQAQGSSQIKNIKHLRYKESDRLEAMAEALRQVGCAVELSEESIKVTPASIATAPKESPKGLQTIHFKSYQDHRIVMAGSLLALNFRLDRQKDQLRFMALWDDPLCVGKSFPSFWEEWAKLQE